MPDSIRDVDVGVKSGRDLRIVILLCSMIYYNYEDLVASVVLQRGEAG